MQACPSPSDVLRSNPAGVGFAASPESAVGAAVGRGAFVATERSGAQARIGSRPPCGEAEPSLLGWVTLVVWVGCVGVGVAGLTLEYPRAESVALPTAAPPIQMLVAQLTPEPLPLPPPEPSPHPSIPSPPPTAALDLPAAPSLVAVAEPTPAVAFALPVEGPVRVVDGAEAAHERPATTPSAEPVAGATGVVRPLTLGEGEGRQPAPEYPRPAVQAQQEGTVRVRLSVGPDGRVLTAEAVAPCVWPLLNDAAVRVVRERWRFAAGEPRLYEVAMRFALNR